MTPPPAGQPPANESIYDVFDRAPKPPPIGFRPEDGPWFPPTSVQPIERKFQTQQPEPLETSFRHSGWAARRALIQAAMIGAGLPAARRERFDCCGADAWIWASESTGQLEVRAQHCHDRWCVPCQRARAARVTAAFRQIVPRARCVALVLTIRSNDRPLGEQIDTLYRHAANLRRSSWWKAHCAGGCQVFEVTHNTDTGQWHPHLHCLVHCQWLEQDELSALWEKITGDSKIVHVSEVKQVNAAVREATKYVGKIVHRSVAPHPELLQELMRALNGRHLVMCWGTWRGDPLLAMPDDDGPTDWRPLGSVVEFHKRAADGDRAAIATLALLTARARGNPTPVIAATPPSG